MTLICILSLSSDGIGIAIHHPPVLVLQPEADPVPRCRCAWQHTHKAARSRRCCNAAVILPFRQHGFDCVHHPPVRVLLRAEPSSLVGSLTGFDAAAIYLMTPLPLHLDILSLQLLPLHLMRRGFFLIIRGRFIRGRFCWVSG